MEVNLYIEDQRWYTQGATTSLLECQFALLPKRMSGILLNANKQKTNKQLKIRKVNDMEQEYMRFVECFRDSYNAL